MEQSEWIFAEDLITKSRILPFLKMDDELGIVFGWATICQMDGRKYVDLQRDHIPQEAMLRATANYSKGSVRVVGYRHEKDTGRLLKSVIGRGQLVFSFPLTEEIAKAVGVQSDIYGWLIGMKPDDEMLDAFKKGDLYGFSIGGKVVRKRTLEVDA